MWPLGNAKSAYQPLKTVIEEGESIDLDDSPSEDLNPPPRSRWRLISATALCIAVVLSTLAIMIYDHLTSFPATTNQPTDSSNCPQRREWRTLTPAEQQHYISSVQCLSNITSALPQHANQSSLHEDFPWIHAHVGYATHHSAAFLPWHRYFLHLYHRTLRERCGYRGELVYWDWTLDWADLAHAPVFDAVNGFGGDGDATLPITVGNSGRCVTTGPFAHLHAQFYDVKYSPHCLSRGFRCDNGTLGVMDGRLISPASIDEVLQIASYEGFVESMESRVHDAIPFGVGGDFETFTAPYDPLFFLHHTQLDRLWWVWQQGAGGEERWMEYGGHKARHSIEMAGLDDEIKMQGLSVTRRVREVMRTDGREGEEEGAGEGLLCYRY